MPSGPLSILFGVGLGLFGVAVLAFLLWGTFMWVFRHAENPSHLIVWACAVYTIMYAALLVDGTSVLRTGDGVEYPWIRGAANAIVYVLLALMTSVALWMSMDNTWISLALAAAGGACFVLADAFSTPRSWWWFSFGLLTQLLQTALSLRRSRRSGNRAWLLMLMSLIWTLGMPIGQALSWTLGRALDSPPHRLNSEIFFIVVSGLGIIVYGATAMLLWRPVPLPPAAAELINEDAQAQAQPPAPVVMASPIGASLRHRNVAGRP